MQRVPDNYGLWLMAKEVIDASGYSLTPECEGYLQQFIEDGELNLRNTLQDLIRVGQTQPYDQPYAVEEVLRQSSGLEWRWLEDITLLEPVVAVRVGSEILQAEARLNMLRFVGEMMNIARREGLTELHEGSFGGAHQLCPIWPFC